MAIIIILVSSDPLNTSSELRNMITSSAIFKFECCCLWLKYSEKARHIISPIETSYITAHFCNLITRSSIVVDKKALVLWMTSRVRVAYTVHLLIQSDIINKSLATTFSSKNDYMETIDHFSIGFASLCCKNTHEQRQCSDLIPYYCKVVASCKFQFMNQDSTKVYHLH